jgi:hypothetical protein
MNKRRKKEFIRYSIYGCSAAGRLNSPSRLTIPSFRPVAHSVGHAGMKDSLRLNSKSWQSSSRNTKGFYVKPSQVEPSFPGNLLPYSELFEILNQSKL